MNKNIKRTLLYFLYFLVYCKRALAWSFSLLIKFFSLIFKLFNLTIGLQIYKLFLKKTKSGTKINLPWAAKFTEFLGKRTILQIIILAIGLCIIIPQSKLYTKNSLAIPGQQTLLYKLVGPGDEDFTLEDVNADWQTTVSSTVNSWKQGMVTTQNINGTATSTEQSSLGDLALGGTAICKPNIIPGATLGNNSESTGRTETVNYVVKTGDTISTIADDFEVTQATILWANGLTAKSYLHPGDKIKIPPASGVVHKVKSGDTIKKLAKLYNCDEASIIKFNRLNTNGTDIRIGEELMIPNGTKPVVAKPIVKTKIGVTQTNRQTSPLPSVGVSGSYTWPTAVRRITQYYSWRHTGLDVAGPIGTPIYATRAGTVIKSQCGWNGGYGCYIIIDHGNGIQSLYGHNSRLFVSVGEEVEQGQNISLMGSTGRSTGPHCHFEIRRNGAKVNPLGYIR